MGAVVGPVTALKTARRTETQTHQHENVHSQYPDFLIRHCKKKKNAALNWKINKLNKISLTKEVDKSN